MPTTQALSILTVGFLAVAVQAQAGTPAAPQAPAPATASPQDPAEPRRLDPERYDHFGAGILEGPSTEVAVALRTPDDYVGKPVRLHGRITAVCQVKGCWMHLGDGEPPVMVKFKDYAFFVPKDATGRDVVVEGQMALKQETVEQTRHYLEDAGRHEEAAKVTEGRKLYHLVATGVAIAKPAKLDPERYDHFGAGILEGPWTEVAVALQTPEDFVGKPVRLHGRITQVCQTKGCWMHLGDGQPPVMVKFKDYAFFVPKDATGRDVVVEGQMALKQETVEQTRHYLEDAGRHEEAAKITEGRKLYHFVATGVAIEKPRD